MLSKKSANDVTDLTALLAGDRVRRIDWDQCTIISADQLNAAQRGQRLSGSSGGDAVADSDALSAVRQLLKSVQLDPEVPLYVASTEGVVIHASAGYRALSEVSETPSASLYGGGLETLPRGLMAVIEEVRSRGRSLSLQEKVRVKGRVRHYRSRHFPIRDDGNNVIAVGGTYVDCTREVEEIEAATAVQARFRDFARASSDWFWETDRDGRFTSLSDRLTAYLGAPASLLIGRSFEGVGALQTREDGRVPMLDAMKSQRPFRDQVLVVASRDGNMLVFHVSGVPVFDVTSGEFSGYRGVGTDITQRMRSEQQADEIKRSLENMLEELTNKNLQLDVTSAKAAEAVKVKNEFLAAMSHELRTPLNAIIGFAEAMKLEVFGSLSNQYKNYSDDILNAGRHLLGLINDVLDVAVLESDRIVLEHEAASLRSIIDKAFTLVTIRASKKQLDVSAIELVRDWTLYIDVRRATQIFVNLFSNAVKFTPEGGAIGIDVQELDNNMLAITVWDTGIGIPPDQHEAVFEKFQQCVDNIYARREEGTGLGLHISKHLAQLMGGDITLESAVGVGSRFTVTLPLDRSKEAGNPA